MVGVLKHAPAGLKDVRKQRSGSAAWHRQWLIKFVANLSEQYT